MSYMLATLLTFCLSVAIGCQPPDCDRPDFGSCGNACCNMEYHFHEMTPRDLYESMQKVFEDGGPDGRYSLQTMADGTTGWTDLSKYNLNVTYIGQVWHTTKVKGYNDTIDMTIGGRQMPGGGSTLKIFSISQIGGAYGDAGQNYKNVVQVVKALDLGRDKRYEEVNVMGCPKPKDIDE